MLSEWHSFMDDVQLSLGSEDSRLVIGLVIAEKWGKLVHAMWPHWLITLRSVHNDRRIDCTNGSVPATLLLMSRVEGLSASLFTFKIARLIYVTGNIEGGGSCGEGGALCMPHEIGGCPWTFKLVVWDRGSLKLLLGIPFLWTYWFIMMIIVPLMVHWLGLSFYLADCCLSQQLYCSGSLSEASVYFCDLSLCCHHHHLS